MPTYQFEALDATGQEIHDVIEAPSEEEAQATIRQMGYFVTKISVKKVRKAAAEKKQRRPQTGLRHRRRQVQGPDHLHPAAVDPAGRRPADPAQPANPRRPAEAGPAEEQPDGHLRRDRRRARRSPRRWPSTQGLRPAVRQHDQGRRGGRCPGSDSPAPGRVPGTIAIAEAQGQRRAGLPGASSSWWPSAS